MKLAVFTILCLYLQLSFTEAVERHGRMRKRYNTPRLSGETSLGKFYGNKKWFGAAIDYQNMDDPNYRNCAAKRFNHCVGEWQSHWNIINETWQGAPFHLSDETFKFCKQNSMTTHLHAGLWYGQAPKEILNYQSIGNQEQDKENLLSKLDAHFASVCGHYAENGLVDVFIVINEVLNDNDGGYRQWTYYNHFGPEYVVHSYNMARKYCKGMKLALNEGGVEGLNAGKWEGFMKLLQYLESKNVKFDIIGLESHFFGRVPTFREMTQTLKAITDRGYEVMISEFDNWRLAGPVDQETWSIQVADFINACTFNHRCLGFTQWGVLDRKNGWYTGHGNDRLLYDENCQLKGSLASRLLM